MYGYLLKIIFRGMLRQKTIFTIKVFSFVIAFLFSVFVLEWMHFEQNFDRWPSDFNQIYRLTIMGTRTNDTNLEFAFVTNKWIKEIPAFFPEVEEMVRLEQQFGNIAIRAGEKKFNTRALFGADSNVFEVFDAGFEQGKKENILDKPNTAVISKSLAEKCFGGTDCINKVVECSQTWDSTYTAYNIVGVFNNFPAQSHFHPEMIISYNNPEDYQRRNYVYLKLKKGAMPESILARFDEFKHKHCDISGGNDFVVHLQPVKDIHLLSSKARELESPGNPVVLKMFFISALALLIIVLINYTNLQLGQYSQDFKMFFVQKIMGSRKKIQFSYLFMNSCVILTLSLLISLSFFPWVARVLKNYLDLHVIIGTKHILGTFFLLYAIFLVVVSAIAFYVVYVPNRSRQKTVQLFLQKQTVQPGLQKSRTRSVLVVAQAIVTICAIIASIIAVKQLNFLTQNRLGQGRNNIVVLKNLPRKAVDNYEVFKEELLTHSDILAVSSSMEEPSGQTNDSGAYILDGKKSEDKRVFILPVDYNFNAFYNNELLSGEDLTYVSDRKASERYVINETAMRYLGFSSPEEAIGKKFEYLLPYPGFFYPGYISGVVKDFYLSTMEEETKPLVMYYLTFFNYSFSVKINPNNVLGAIDVLSETWQQMFPDYPMDYFFIDQLYNKVYAQYIVQSKFMNIILVVILLISNIGFLATVSLQINRRIKEIGVRKVNGAKSYQLVLSMNKPVIVWISTALLIASPLAWFAIDKWLNNFAYRTSLNWWVFLLAGVMALFIALLTVSFKTWKAATSNPVEALRYE
jgi:putative ABC transport system permease protein